MPYLCTQKWRAARYAGEFSMAWGIPIAPLLSGSGKVEAPCARMHWENLSACARTWGDRRVTKEVGSSDLQACTAAVSCELLTPS